MADEPREIELKFVLPAGRAEALLAELPLLSATPPRSLSAVYFDTPKRALRRAGLSLRVRAQDGGFVQTLKNGGDGTLARGEWETPLTSGEPALASLAKTPGGAVLRRHSHVQPQFTVEVRRRSASVAEGESEIELSFDEGEAAGGGKQAPFAELELELKSGPTSGLFALARKLASAGDLTLSFTTKAERGFSLVAPPRARAKKFVVPRLSPKMSAGEAFRVVAYACLRQIAGNAERLRERAAPEVVHQLRVGLRRLRSLLTTFGPVVDDARLPALKAELAWLTIELDAARNLDVLLQGDYRAALREKENADGLKGLGARLRGARRIAYARAAAAVESERFRRLLLDVLTWIEIGAWTAEAAKGAEAREQPVLRFARKALSRRRRRIVRTGADLAALEPPARHRLRIAAKKMRYAADVFAGLFGRRPRARRFIDALKAVQDRLGELNDIVVGEALAHEVAAGGGWTGAVTATDAEAEAAFTAGRITGAQKARTAPLLKEAQDAIDAFAQAKPFWPK
ncbi:MAG: CHAD domain-containing protein [Caulobacterales bacterium]